MKIVSLCDAKQAGLARYFTGKQCVNGHIAERYVGGRKCVECAKEESKRHEKKLERKESKAAYYLDNKDKINARNKAYYHSNASAASEKKKLYNEIPENKQRKSQYNKAYAQQHKAGVCARAKKYQASKIGRTPSWANEELIKPYYDVCAFFNEVNGYVKYHVDHIIPLQGKIVSGLHVHNNLQVILAVDNVRKNNFYIPH